MTVIDAIDILSGGNLTPEAKSVLKLIERGRKQWGDKYDPSDLLAAQHFAPFYFSKERVKVSDSRTQDNREYGGAWIRTGTVGMTTGWKPAFLLMHRSSDTGSSDVLSNYDTIIAIRNKRERYIPVR